MPDTETYTIAGESFDIPQPYAEGHVLTPGEASQLNQVYAENIRNNLAGKVKEQKEAGTFDKEVFQGAVYDYCENYAMGVRTGGGGRTGDPVMQEALVIAKNAVRNSLKKAGYTLSEVTAAQITERAKAAIASTPKILELAKARVEATKDIAIDVLEEEAPAPKASKSKAA